MLQKPVSAALAFLALTSVVYAGDGGQAKSESGFISIFDGKTLQGWDGDPRFWRIEDGCITGQTTPDNPTPWNTFLIWRGGEVSDFELKLEFRILSGNSGIQYRAFRKQDWPRWVVGGYQADIDAGNRYTGALYGERFRGMLAERGEKTVIGPDHKRHVVGSVGDRDELAKVIKKGQWNEYHVIARGFEFIHKINGHVMIHTVDKDKQMRRRSGLLAFQLHRGPPMKVQFRNIRLKHITENTNTKANSATQEQLKNKAASQAAGSKKLILFIAGPDSHSRGAHEHYAGCRYLADLLNKYAKGVRAVVCRGWPEKPELLRSAAAIIIYCDGGRRHLALNHLQELDALMKQGVGLGCLHYAVEVPKGKPGEYMLNWIGGYFETYWSVNPTWTPKFEKFPDHPISRGLKPFSIRDEWYFHMRFREGMVGVTPILSAVAPASTMRRPDGPHSGNPHVRAAVARGEPQHVAWAYERPDGGRGFGFTGGHFHANWADDNFRKVVLNAALWLAKVEVPPDGVQTPTPTQEELEAYLP